VSSIRAALPQTKSSSQPKKLLSLLEDPMKFYRSPKVMVIALFGLSLIVAAAIAVRTRPGSVANASFAHRDPEQPPYVAVARAKRVTIANSLSIAGQFLPYQNVDLHAKVAGYIRQINVDIGDRVHKGKVLAVLEIPELVAQVDEAEATVRRAEQEIQRAQSDVLRAEADHLALHDNAARLVKAAMDRPGLIAQQELDDATAKDRASQALVDAAKSSLAAAVQQLAVARANQQHYSALNDYAKITAPYDGVVTWRFSDTGALVQAGTSTSSGLPVVTLAQINVLRLRIPVPESLASKIRMGDIADVHVQATGEHFIGKVARFTDSLDPSTRTMQVEVDVPNPDYHLQPGMYANVRLDADTILNALTIPIEAVRRSDNSASVLVVDGHNRVESRDVKLGIDSTNRVQILSGLSLGEQVIVGNLGAYQAGELVRPKQAVFAASEGSGAVE
jgi:RND family efflux transporter MFP subunit